MWPIPLVACREIAGLWLVLQAAHALRSVYWRPVQITCTMHAHFCLRSPQRQIQPQRSRSGKHVQCLLYTEDEASNTLPADFFEGEAFPIDAMLKGDFGPVMDFKGRHEPDVVIPIFDKVRQSSQSCKILEPQIQWMADRDKPASTSPVYDKIIIV